MCIRDRLSYTFKDKRVDYYFKNYSVNDDSIFVEIENRTGNVVPFPLQLETKVGSKEIWNDGFSGTQKLSFPKQYDYEIIKNVTIDRNLIVREVSRKDNRLKIHGSKNSADIRNIHFFSKTIPVSYTHLRAHETVLDLVCRLLLEKKNTEN